MMNALLSIKQIAVIAGFILGSWEGVALTQSVDSRPLTESQNSAYPSAPTTSASAQLTSTVATTPVPTVSSALFYVTIRGIACIDRDISGVCASDEARVPNVIVRNSNGIATVTNSSGEYTLQAALHSELDITIPTGYKSINGNLHRYRLQMADSSNVDIALAVDAAYTPVGSTNELTDVKDNKSNQSSADDPLFTIDNTLVRVGAVIAVILAALLVFLVIRFLRRFWMYLVNHPDYEQRDKQFQDIAKQLEASGGWKTVAGQIVADMLHQTITIDESAGILNAIAEPSPRFSIVTFDRRAVMFTTNPGFLRKAHLMRRGDRIIDITARSALNHTSIRVLWQHICTTRNMLPVTPPDRQHWYMVVRAADNRPNRKRQTPATLKKVLPKPKSAPYQPWRGPS